MALQLPQVSGLLLGPAQQRRQRRRLLERVVARIIGAEQTFEAITGTPAATASETTLAPPSRRELSTSAWARAKALRTAPPVTSPRQS